MAKMLMGAFRDRDQADQAIYELEHFGYRPKDMSVITCDKEYVSREDTGAGVAASTATSATTGGLIGGLAGLLAGVGLVPVLSGLFVGGPIALALGLTGAAAAMVSGALTGAAAGGLIGALTALGLPKETAESYDRTVQAGGIVVGLTQRDNITDEARKIMQKHGAHDVTLIDLREEAEDMRVERQFRQQPVFGEHTGTREEHEIDDI